MSSYLFLMCFKCNFYALWVDLCLNCSVQINFPLLDFCPVSHHSSVFRHTNHSVLVGKTILWNLWQSSLTRMLSEGEFTLSWRIKQHTHSSVWVRRQLFIWWLKGNSAVLIPSLWGEKTVKTFSSTPERDGRWRQGRFEQLCSDQQVADMKQIMWDVSNKATWNVLHDLIIYEKPTCTACLKGSDLKCLKVFVFFFNFIRAVLWKLVKNLHWDYWC